MINMFCIPYAGASAACYHTWKERLQNDANLIAIELLGRGTRYGKGFYESFEDAVIDIIDKMYFDLHQAPYVLFGHSMGSTLAYEAARHIDNLGLPRPTHIIFSGRLAPDFVYNDNLHELPDNQFRHKILEFGAVTSDMLDSDGVTELLFPILRADFKMINSYHYAPSSDSLLSDISILYGEQDDYTNANDLKRWSSYTKGQTTFYRFNGGHFFIHNDQASVMTVIENILRQCKV